MNRRSILTKTGKGLMEATGKTSILPRELRNLLKDIDGKVSVSELLDLGKMAESKLLDSLNSLERDGYVREFVTQSDEGPRTPIGRVPTAQPSSESGEDLDFTAFKPAKPSAKSVEDAKLQAQAQEIARQAQMTRAREEAAAKAKAEAALRAKAAAEAAARAKAEAEQRGRAFPEIAPTIDIRAKSQADALDRARRDAEERQRREAEEKERREAEARARVEAELAVKRQAEESVRREQQEKAAKRDEEARAKREEDDRIRREAEERARREIDELTRKEIEARRARDQAERLKREEEERARKIAEERERHMREERERAEREARIEAEARAKVEGELRARREAEERARREEEERRQQESRRRAEEEARRRREEEERREQESRRRAEEAARKQREAEELENLERALREQEEQARLDAEEAEREEQARKEEEEQSRRESEESKEREKEEAKREKEEAKRAREEERARARADAREAEKLRKGERSRERASEESWRGDEDLAVASGGEAVSAGAAWAKKRPRSLSKQLAVLLFAVLIVGVAVLPFVPLETAGYERAAQEWLGEPVKIGSVTLSLVPTPQLRFEKVAIDKVRVASIRATPEISSLLFERKALKRLELNNATLPKEFLGAFLEKSKGRSPGVERIVAKGLKIDIPELHLPPLDLDAVVGPDGGLAAATLSSSESALSVTLRPQEGRAGIEITSGSFPLPIGADFPLSEFQAKGTVTRNELVLSSVEGRVFGGRLRGSARLRWSDGWTLTGGFEARQLEAAKIAGPLVGAGTLEGKATYSMKGLLPERMLLDLHLEGDFAIQKGSISNVDMTRLLQGSSAGGGTTLFSEMSGKVLADPNRLLIRQIRMAAGLLSATGQAEMDAQKNLSGRLQIELRAQTVQARTSVALTGTLKDPQFRRGN